MRIRKRFPPSSSLSSVHLPDPQLDRSTLVQLQQLHQPHRLQSTAIQVHPLENQRVREAKINSQPPDPPNRPPPSPSRGVCSDAGHDKEKVKQKDLEGEDVKDDAWKAGSGLLLSPSASHQVLGEWGEGSKVGPLKKRRRGSFQRGLHEEEAVRKMQARVRNQEYKQPSGDEEEDEKKESIQAGMGNTTSAKKGKRGSVLKEGSRCSRVNGRGWRCCQQTLVGYSLCEHHLGKGRLRSMTRVRDGAMADCSTAAADVEPAHAQEEEKLVVGDCDNDQNQAHEHHHHDKEDKKPLMVTKKRMKLGVVKARSISSLLGQTNNATELAGSNKNSS
ncbi:hypothetical protein RJ640_029377 [Escallonia rubra]|uniref:WRC domain-containing protein n=1 Tax=Escallonia rubra TaxID=112253 RepID=A0AA88SFQ7_9ASTE|nr:hypothetical protein RJ640_029377 [Escallonia rubra]